jgi:hypothetical protein
MFTYFAEGSFKILVGFGLILQTHSVEQAACKVFDAGGINNPVK